MYVNDGRKHPQNCIGVFDKVPKPVGDKDHRLSLATCAKLGQKVPFCNRIQRRGPFVDDEKPGVPVVQPHESSRSENRVHQLVRGLQA